MNEKQLIVLDYLKHVDASPFWAVKELTNAAAAKGTMLSSLVPTHVKQAYIDLSTVGEAEVLIALGEYVKKREELLRK